MTESGPNHMPTVSVVVPNYNHARFLRQRIDSILAQTYQDFELILLDDCSTDESREILRSYASDARVRLEFNETNSGTPFKQWNKGVRMARGEYVWIAESDDYADRRLLERLLGVLKSGAKTKLAYCRSWAVREDGQLDGFAEAHFPGSDQDCWDRDYRVNGVEICRTYMIRTNVIQNASAVVFRRAAYEEVGGADETMRLCGDWKLWAAMMLQGEIGYVAEPLNNFRFHALTVRDQLYRSGAGIAEWLHVVGWIMERVDPSWDIAARARADQAQHWVPAVLSFRIPWTVRRQIWRAARNVDPHPIWRAIRPALATLRRKMKRQWQEAVAQK